jgi:hypothetical protein
VAFAVVPAFLILGPFLLVALLEGTVRIAAPPLVRALLFDVAGLAWAAGVLAWAFSAAVLGVRTLPSIAVFVAVWAASLVCVNGIAARLARIPAPGRPAVALPSAALFYVPLCIMPCMFVVYQAGAATARRARKRGEPERSHAVAETPGPSDDALPFETRWARTLGLAVVPLLLLLTPVLWALGAPVLTSLPTWFVVACVAGWPLAWFALLLGWLFALPSFGLRALTSTAVLLLLWALSVPLTEMVVEDLAGRQAPKVRFAGEPMEVSVLVSMGLFLVLAVVQQIALRIVRRRDRPELAQVREELGPGKPGAVGDTEEPGDPSP